MPQAIDIKELRKRLDWSQERLAEFLGLDRSSVSRMESGQPPKGPTLRLLEQLASSTPLQQSAEAAA